jgi:hypothetical protein
MSRTALPFAGLFAAVAAALFSCGRSPSLPTGPSTIVNVQVVAPSTIAPGSTAQLSALANYTDGSTKDVTAAALWHSSDTSILTISATGLASGIQIGAVNITASSSNHVSAMQSILVVPAGTFRLSGFVTGLGSSLDGALVQVTAGTGAGLSSSTVNGTYQLLGVAGNIQVTVSKTAYVTATLAVTVNNNTTLNVDLVTVAPPPGLAGTYALAITADPACMTTGAGALPSVARERQYAAVIKQTGNQVTAALSGANFSPNSSHSLYGLLAPDGATFDVNDPIYYYSGWRDLAELLPDGSVYLASGNIDLTLSGKDLVGTLNGTIRVAVGPTLPNLGTFVGQCASTSHSVTFTNSSGSPARVRIRR